MPDPNPNPTPDPNANPNPAPAEWLKPFGEHAKTFEGIKDPAELATKWTAANTELTTLRAAKPQAFDWRKELAGDDENAKKALERFTDPKTFTKSFIEAQNKLRSGDFARPLPANATADQIKDWRAANGVPEKPEGYFEKLPDGLVIGADDKPLFDAYAKVWHDNNASTPLVHAMTKMYFDGQAKMKADEAQVDRADAQKTVGELRTKWGGSYESNMAILNNWVEGMGADIAPLFRDATLGDGTRLFNNAGVVEALASVARQLNPAAHLLPAGGEANIMSIDAEIAKIDKMMRTDRKAYNADPKIQERYRELITAKQKLGSRAA